MTNHYKTNAQLKDRAKDALTGHYANAILINLLLTCISNSVTFLLLMAVPKGNGVLSVLSLLFTLCVFAVMGVLQLGLSLFFLNIASGRPGTIQDLFYGFRCQSKEALTVSAIFMLLRTVSLAPYQECLNRFLLNKDNKWLLYSLFCLIIGTLIYIFISLYFSQAFYLLLDFPGKGGFEALKLSRQLMKGNKKRLFLLQLSFIPLMFLCLFSFGIGFLWLKPYMNMVTTQFYLDLMNPQTVKEA